MKVTLLDYGAGNVRSIRNALARFGCEIKDVETGADILDAQVLVFPGVGVFGPAMERLQALGVVDALRTYLKSNRAFLGICIGLQVLFETSSESPGVEGLGVLEGRVERFSDLKVAVPHIGWNSVVRPKGAKHGILEPGARYYFVHSYRAETKLECASGLTTYGGEVFASVIERGLQCATQFHPEKSGAAGLSLIERFLHRSYATAVPPCKDWWTAEYETHLAKRIVCALDVRENDDGDLVVTKGDGYDVREEKRVRNLGKPVELAERYYDEGGDEIAILNICAFRGEPLGDLPLLEVLRQASERVFVPVTIGGGVRSYTDARGVCVDALDVAAAYFRAGADKISIGSDAVYAALQFHDANRPVSSIEKISRVYGKQAVVVSIDPKRVWLEAGEAPPIGMFAVEHPDGTRCWYQCTVKGGRQPVLLDARQLAIASQYMGAGELMLNCIDCDGKKSGFDLPLLTMIKDAVTIPVIASSGAGKPDHFVQAFTHTDVDAALAAGIFHRREVPIADVKTALSDAGLIVR